jgi:hypothetical protein
MNNSLKDWVDGNLTIAEAKKKRLEKIEERNITQQNYLAATGGKITVLKQVKDWLKKHPEA